MHDCRELSRVHKRSLCTLGLVQWSLMLIPTRSHDILGDEDLNSRYGHTPDSDSIKAYLERASLYFAANAIDHDKKVPILDP